MLYEAGRRSVTHTGWPILTGVFAAASLVLGVGVVTTPKPVTQIVYLPAPVQPSVVRAEQQTVREAQTESARGNVFSLLILGVPKYLPAQSARAQEIDHWIDGSSLGTAPVGLVSPVQPRDRLGLPPGSLGNPFPPPMDFGPIRRGDV